LLCSFMSLGYELVIFCKFIKFIKFMLFIKAEIPRLRSGFRQKAPATLTPSKRLKFIKFILVSTSCNSETSGAKPQLPQKRRKLGTPAVEQGDLKDDLRPEVTSGGVQIASIISKIFRPICFQKVRSRFTEQQQAHDFAHL
jgi:hypothetical protein